MARLFDRIKQSLRSLVLARRHPRRAERSVTDGTMQVPTPPHLRTELDPERPSELERWLLTKEYALPPGSTRQRKANLSKARRAVPGQNALSVWGLSGPARTSLFNEHASSERPPLFTGSTLTGRASQSAPALSPAASDWTLQGSSLFAPQTDARREPLPLFGPADGLGAPDDRNDGRF